VITVCGNLTNNVHRNNTRLTAILQDSPGKPVTECLHSAKFLLEIRMMEVVVLTTGAVRWVKRVSQIVTNKPTPGLLKAGCFPVA